MRNKVPKEKPGHSATPSSTNPTCAGGGSNRPSGTRGRPRTAWGLVGPLL